MRMTWTSPGCGVGGGFWTGAGRLSGCRFGRRAGLVRAIGIEGVWGGTRGRRILGTGGWLLGLGDEDRKMLGR